MPKVSAGVHKKTVEVISVTRAVEGASGDSIYQVQFGEMIEVGDDLKPFVPPNQLGGRPPKKLAAATIILFYKEDKPVPYVVGTRWDLTINGDGQLTLSREE